MSAALAGLCALALAMGIGRFAYTPVLPYMQADYGLSVQAAGYVASANFAGYLAGALLAISVPAGHRRFAFLAGVVTSVATTLAMALLAQPVPMAIVRALSGAASAFALIHGSAIVLDRLARDGKPALFSLLYAGVGVGIALSALVVELAARAAGSSSTQWLVLGLVSLALAPLAANLRDDASRAAARGPPVAAASAPAAPPTAPAQAAGHAVALRWLVVAYGCLGFGYVITATFIVVIVRARPEWQALEMAVWLVVGLAAAPSNYLWLRVMQRFGPWRALTAAYLLEALGVAAAVSGHSLALVGIGAALLGGTFVGITALGLTTARNLAPGTAGPVIARMTAAFGFGQIAGPALGGWMAERTGGFGWPSALAALALLAAAAMVAIAGRRAAGQ
ncbi:MAG TPA: YbfB/YjiJ family MFS transporter [Burkholderiaceae bacterium]